MEEDDVSELSGKNQSVVIFAWYSSKADQSTTPGCLNHTWLRRCLDSLSSIMATNENGRSLKSWDLGAYHGKYNYIWNYGWSDVDADHLMFTSSGVRRVSPNNSKNKQKKKYCNRNHSANFENWNESCMCTRPKGKCNHALYWVLRISDTRFSLLHICTCFE